MTRVLVVEDDTLLARQFVQTLERAGFVADHAAHAGEAIMAIDESTPDVIVLDMLLPATSGLTLLHELQSYQDTAALPVVVCSSLAGDISFEELRPYGVRRLLDKTTMHPDDIVVAVRALT